MKEVQTKSPTDCGIIIGRFMIHELHSMHIDLIQTVLDKHDRVIVFLGVAPI
jgi:nicotinamide mononucleotide adenylyltransferase